MGYERNDRRYGRDDRSSYGRGDYGRSEYGRADYGRNDGGRDRYDDPNDRGFFERAGDEVRSWFGDEEAERRRRMDERYDERYGNDYGRERSQDGGRYAEYSQGGYRGPDRYPAWNRSNRDEGRSGYSRGQAPTSYSYPATGEDRQFEGGYPDSQRGRGYGSTGARYGTDRQDDYRSSYGQQQSQHDDDHHGYQSWRNRQISQFDRDYDEYRQENRSRFESEFATWRQNRQGQRDSLQQVQEHMEVVGSDGTHVGKVDHVRGDRILLTKTDRDAGGHHHSIPSSWIRTVDDKVHLARSADEAKKAWRDEEANQGLFGSHTNRDGNDDRGAANLGRSFSGTY